MWKIASSDHLHEDLHEVASSDGPWPLASSTTCMRSLLSTLKRGRLSPLAAASAVACSPSSILSCSTTETQKIISSVHGVVMVESM